MITSVSLQYAQALFELAKENQQIDEYASDLEVAKQLLIDDKKNNQTLHHPSVSIQSRKEIIEQAFQSYVTPTFLNFLKVLVDNQRLNELGDIVDAYHHLQDEQNKVCHATAYVRYPLEQQEQHKIIQKLEQQFGKKVTLSTVIDESIIGGIKIVVDGKIVDATIQTEMLDLKNQLKKGW